MRVGKHDGGRESAQDDVAQLDASRGYHVAEGEVILAEEFGEVVEEDKEEAQGAPVEVAAGGLKVSTCEERREELEEGEEQLVESGPSLRTFE